VRMKTIALFVGTLLLASLPALAHHPFSSEFDKNKPVTLNGTVTKVEWTKPHAYIYMDVKNEGGKTEQWKLETASSEYLAKQGMKDTTLKIGEKVTVNGYNATTGDHLASARMLTMANGHSMQVCDPKEDGGPAK